MKPPLGLEVQVANPDGSEAKTLIEYTTDPRKLADIGPFTTKLNTGYESASVSTERDQRLTYGWPRLLQEMKLKKAGNKSAWEGRVSKTPVGRNDDVSAVGWWDGLKDATGVAEVYSDKSMERWQGISSTRQATFLAANYSPTDGSAQNGTIKLTLATLPWTSPGLPVTSMLYVGPPGVSLGSISCAAIRTSSAWNTADANFGFSVGLSTDADVTSYDTSGDVAASLATAYSISVPATTATRRYAFIDALYAAANASVSSQEYAAQVEQIAVKGDHGLTNIYASEVIKHAIGKYCPLLTATDQTIEATSYAIGHLVFDGATVADVIQKVNAYHIWRFAVWDDRVCYFAPQKDLTDYDYEIPYTGEYRGTLEPAGPEVDDDTPINGVWVYYTDVQTGRPERVGPYGTSAPYDTAGDSSLLASSDLNACNRAGQNRFGRIDMSYNCTRADAIQMGSLRLAEAQVKVNAGSGSAREYVKNRAGAWVPAMDIRAGDRVKYSHETNTIREVYATSYDPSSFTNSLTFEKPDSTVEGINERIQMSLQAAGIA